MCTFRASMIINRLNDSIFSCTKGLFGYFIFEDYLAVPDQILILKQLCAQTLEQIPATHDKVISCSDLKLMFQNATNALVEPWKLYVAFNTAWVNL
jgi:hypothetical protein